MNEDESPADELYVIADMQGFCKTVRIWVADDLEKDLDIQEHIKPHLDELITLNQAGQTIKQHSLQFEYDENLYINTDTYNTICADILESICGSWLCKLGAADVIEVGWDNKLNTAIFWPKDKKKK